MWRGNYWIGTFESFAKMSKNKSPGNDRITKEFYEGCWNDLETPLILGVNKAFKVGELLKNKQSSS